MTLETAIEIAPAGRGFVVTWKDREGKQQAQTCANRTLLARLIFDTAAIVRGDDVGPAFPQLPSEEASQ